MATQHTYVIVGAGLAGAKAAQTLREEGFTGRLVLIGDEPERPYERPPLSKGYLTGTDAKTSIYVHDEGWYQQNSVELLLGRRATGLDLAAHEVQLDGNHRLGYHKLLLATGASPRRLDLPGAGLDGIHYLRGVADAERLREEIRSRGRVAVVGAGWIGLETAAAARGYGCDVTVIEPQPMPLQASLGPEMGALFADVHRRHGVDLRLGETVSGFAGQGRVASVLTDGGEIPADVVIVGIGARPNTELAEAAGLAVDNGVLVDPSLRTEHPDVYAAGDVANALHPRYGSRIRVEHWATALHAAPAAARNMLGQQVSYERPPYFFTDQYDLGMEFTGWFAPGRYDTVVTRGDLTARGFHAFWLTDGRVVAGMHVNQWDEGIATVQQLLGEAVDPRRLADTDVPLSEAIKGARRQASPAMDSPAGRSAVALDSPRAGHPLAQAVWFES